MLVGSSQISVYCTLKSWTINTPSKNLYMKPYYLEFTPRSQLSHSAPKSWIMLKTENFSPANNGRRRMKFLFRNIPLFHQLKNLFLFQKNFVIAIQSLNILPMLRWFLLLLPNDFSAETSYLITGFLIDEFNYLI